MAMPAALELANASEQLVGFRPRQRRRRLVEDDDAGVGHQRPRYLDHLLRRNGKIFRLRPWRHAGGCAGGVQRGRGAPLHRRAIESAAVRPLDTEVEVFRNGALGEQVELLVDDAHAGGASLTGVGEDVLDAVELEHAVGRRVHAGDDLHERRLAGTVLADDGVHLTGGHVEVDALQHGHAVERLADAAQGQRRRDASARRRRFPHDVPHYVTQYRCAPAALSSAVFDSVEHGCGSIGR